jgi:ribonuclease HI
MTSSPGTPRRKSSAELPGKQLSDPVPVYTAHIDGGARGNPGPSGYGAVIEDSSGRKVAELSEYLGHQTNNYAEYQGLLGVLHYATEHSLSALKVVSDSELMVRQLKGIYKVKHPELRKLYDEAQALIRKLRHFEIRHAMREHNQEADRLANEAMDRGMSGRKTAGPASQPVAREEYDGVVRNGVIELTNGFLPEGVRVQVRVRR